jgi:uncharacterized phiE125 gp8 family phage protein
MVTGDPIEPGAAALGEAKAYLRIFGSDEDALVARLLAAAAELCEQFTGQALLARGFVETLPAGAALRHGSGQAWRRLGRTPVIAVTSVEALAADGAASPLAVGAYAIDIDAGGDGWVRVPAPGAASRLRVGYDAGLAAGWAELPQALRHGVVRLAAHLYAHRDAARDFAPPAAVTALWRPWRRLRVA